MPKLQNVDWVTKQAIYILCNSNNRDQFKPSILKCLDKAQLNAKNNNKDTFFAE